ncbi:MAG: hypothetical protein AAGG09_14005 [Pseudomonadota bacterium]
MSATTAILTLSCFLTCYALVLAAVWLRAVRALDCRSHVGHFVGLMGVFVPGVALTLAVFLAGVGLGVPQVIPVLALLLPGAVVVGLQAELAHLAASGPRPDAERLTIALGLTLAFLAWG